MANRKQTEPTETSTGKPRTFAHYGPWENKRTCDACGSPESVNKRTRTAGRMTVRYRQCLKCGKKRVTQEIDPRVIGSVG
jgi:DNA-directed RNA polymerase subunit M/transcription elongation factor TFIIS